MLSLRLLAAAVAMTVFLSKAQGSSITITEIKPGFLETDLQTLQESGDGQSWFEFFYRTNADTASIRSLLSTPFTDNDSIDSALLLSTQNEPPSSQVTVATYELVPNTTTTAYGSWQDLGPSTQLSYKVYKHNVGGGGLPLLKLRVDHDRLNSAQAATCTTIGNTDDRCFSTLFPVLTTTTGQWVTYNLDYSTVKWRASKGWGFGSSAVEKTLEEWKAVWSAYKAQHGVDAIITRVELGVGSGEGRHQGYVQDVQFTLNGLTRSYKFSRSVTIVNSIPDTYPTPDQWVVTNHKAGTPQPGYVSDNRGKGGNLENNDKIVGKVPMKGSLALTTDANTATKVGVRYISSAFGGASPGSVLLSDIINKDFRISYSWLKAAASDDSVAVPALKLEVGGAPNAYCAGTAGTNDRCYTQFVFENYANTEDSWVKESSSWFEGTWWKSKGFGTPQNQADKRTLKDWFAALDNNFAQGEAFIISLGVELGTFNPNISSFVDGVNINFKNYADRSQFNKVFAFEPFCNVLEIRDGNCANTASKSSSTSACLNWDDTTLPVGASYSGECPVLRLECEA